VSSSGEVSNANAKSGQFVLIFSSVATNCHFITEADAYGQNLSTGVVNVFALQA
jgi:hypothetical protein